jgi:NTE family protein
VINGKEYLDGGLSSPVPVKVARAMGADVVIAVDVSWFAQLHVATAADAERHGRGGRHALREKELEAADIVIVPRTVRARMLDFTHKEANITAGETAGREALPRLRKILVAASRSKQARPRPVEGGANRTGVGREFARREPAAQTP